jgi:signal peptide peptidase SppA
MKIGEQFLASMRGEVWAMQPEKISAFFDAVKTIKIVGEYTEPVAAIVSKKSDPDDYAIINVSGSLMKNVPKWFKHYGIAATSYIEMAEEIMQAANDGAVKGIVLKIESPGGTVSGMEYATRAIEYAKTKKPVTAHIEDIGASAAYWIASAADSVQANKSAEVGSIGVYMVAVDYSEMAKNDGIKVHVVSSGDLKGAGVAGSVIKDEHLDAWQDNINQYAAQFKSYVQGARRMSADEVEIVSTGRTWIAKEAKNLNLIDAVESFDMQNISNKLFQRSMKMLEQERAELAAAAKEQGNKEATDKLNEMLAAFPEDVTFAVASFQAGKSVEDAKAENDKIKIETERAELEKMRAEIEAEKQAIADAKAAEEAVKAEAEKVEAEAVEQAEAVQGADAVEHGTPAATQEMDVVKLGRQIAADEKISIKDAMRKAYAMKKTN